MPHKSKPIQQTPPLHQWRNDREMRIRQLNAQIAKLQKERYQRLKEYTSDSPEVRVIEQKMIALGKELAQLKKLGYVQLVELATLETVG